MDVMVLVFFILCASLLAFFSFSTNWCHMSSQRRRGGLRSSRQEETLRFTSDSRDSALPSALHRPSRLQVQLCNTAWRWEIEEPDRLYKVSCCQAGAEAPVLCLGQNTLNRRLVFPADTGPMDPHVPCQIFCCSHTSPSPRQ